MSPPPQAEILSVAELVEYGVTSLAQWMSRRILSSAKRVESCAWKRRSCSACRLRAGDEDVGDACEDDAHDHHHDEHLDEAVASLSPEAQPAAHPLDHFILASTSASALRATSSLFVPIPQRFCARRSAAISFRSASAPCHQPNAGAGDDPGVLVEEVPDVRLRLRVRGDPRRRSLARCGSGISFSGSVGAPATHECRWALRRSCGLRRGLRGRRLRCRGAFCSAPLGAAGTGAAGVTVVEASPMGCTERADVRRDVFGLALLRIGRALERDGDRRRAGIAHPRAGGRRLARNLVHGIAVDRADDLPGEAGVLERALGEDERLARDIGDDERRDRRRAPARPGAPRSAASLRRPQESRWRAGGPRPQSQGAASGWLSAEP